MEQKLKEKLLSILEGSNDWMMIKDVLAALRRDIDRMYLAGYLDCLAASGSLEFKQVGSAKLYRMNHPS